MPNKKPSLLTKKSSTTLKPRLEAFNNDDSSEDEGQKHVNSQIHKEALKKIVKKQVELNFLKHDLSTKLFGIIFDVIITFGFIEVKVHSHGICFCMHECNETYTKYDIKTFIKIITFHCVYMKLRCLDTNYYNF